MMKDEFDQDEQRDLDLAAAFFAIVQAPELWPTIESEAVTYREQRDAARRELWEGDLS